MLFIGDIRISIHCCLLEHCFLSTILYLNCFGPKHPGKWLSYTKVVDKKGLKPGFIQIFLRSIVRLTIIDCFFIPFLNKPLHDYVSSTEVVEV